MAELPRADTQEYLWWSQGAADEAKARNEGLSQQVREVRDTLESFARARDVISSEGIVWLLARIYCDRRLRRRYRAKR